MMHHRSTSGSAIWRRWHEERELARRHSYSTDEHSAEEIERYDLDSARIDGSDNPETFRTDPYGTGDARKRPHDIREEDRY